MRFLIAALIGGALIGGCKRKPTYAEALQTWKIERDELQRIQKDRDGAAALTAEMEGFYRSPLIPMSDQDKRERASKIEEARKLVAALTSDLEKQKASLEKAKGELAEADKRR